MNRRVYQTVARKRACEGPLQSAEAEVRRQIGSRAWHTRGYLPHCDVPGILQMVTFRQADAMPASRRSEWEALLKIKDEREKRIKIEAYLDLGYGSCVFKQPPLALAVEQVILRFDGRRYRLVAWVIMPNHVHAVVEPWSLPLGELLRAWKGVTANAANRLLGRSGQLWQEEYWDRYIRDEAHFRKAVRFIESNPVKAGLACAAAEWPFGSANPKWHWSGPDRYYGAQLVNARAERGHSCPPVPPGECYSSAGVPIRDSK